MLNVFQDIKRWTIHDTVRNKIYDINDADFDQGLSSGYLKSRGQFIQVENNHKILIDGIVKK